MTWNKSRTTMLMAIILICLLVELIGGVFTAQGVHTWYLQLNKPAWNPPNVVFGPIWTILYILMSFSVWLIWVEPAAKSKRTAYILFWTQMFFNIFWSFLFFTLQNPLLALLDIAILIGLIGWTIKSFYSIKPKAAYLLVPYLLWVAYASTLNFAIWYLNP